LSAVPTAALQTATDYERTVAAARAALSEAAWVEGMAMLEQAITETLVKPNTL